ncbi:MAG TPA: CDP-alcohol phosphatidyltransferase family protein [Ktedonobacterales bacterium]|nr:CDP-alcohol phosphatidyltransferase family protein [Ktedonobacterales bacterium]
MFGPRIQRTARRIAEMVVWPLAAIGMTPNMATLLGLLLNTITAAILAMGSLRLGGVMLLFAGMFDMVDGALARVRNQKTTFGAFFDSTLDRYSEGIVILGIILYVNTLPPSTEKAWTLALAYIAGLGSLMVSYARARAEGLGLEMKSGLMARPERVLVLAVGLILGAEQWLIWTLLLLAVTSVFTSVQRIIAVWLKLSRAAHESTEPESSQSSDARDDSRPHSNGRRPRKMDTAQSLTSKHHS